MIFGNTFIENFRMAFSTLRAHKLRSLLTIVGVVIGVITVMLISSIISGINVAVEKQLESFGTNSIFLYKYNVGIQIGRRSREERMRKPLTFEDAEALKELPTIETAVPFFGCLKRQMGTKDPCERKKRKAVDHRSAPGNDARHRKNDDGGFVGRPLVYNGRR